VKRTIRVHIGDAAKLVGILHYDQQNARESAMFEYDATWLANPANFALEPGLPLVAGPQFHRKTRDGSVFHAVVAEGRSIGMTSIDIDSYADAFEHDQRQAAQRAYG
jgi:serine/threonine-protein kinase HipA